MNACPPWLRRLIGLEQRDARLMETLSDEDRAAAEAERIRYQEACDKLAEEANKSVIISNETIELRGHP